MGNCIDTDFDQLRALDLSKVPKNGIHGGKFRARVMRVYDGDTMTVAMRISSSSTVFRAYQIRLFGCDSPELKGDTAQAGLKAREEVLRYIGAGDVIGKKRGIQENTWFQENPTILTIELMSESAGKIDKYGRELAHVHVPGKEKTLTAYLLETGHAYPYQGGTKDQSRYRESRG